MNRPNTTPPLWAVEMKTDAGAWEPTVGVELCRDAGRATLREWQARLRHDKFRLRRYERAER